MHQFPLKAYPCLFARGLVVEDHLELVSLRKKYDHTSLVEEQTSSWGIDLLPTQLHWHGTSVQNQHLDSSGAFLACVQFPQIAYFRQGSCKHLSL